MTSKTGEEELASLSFSSVVGGGGIFDGRYFSYILFCFAS